MNFFRKLRRAFDTWLNQYRIELNDCKPKLTYGERLIMATLTEVVASLDELKTTVETVDTAVEALYEQIKQFVGQGITSEVADQLMAKVADIRSAVEKVESDD